MISGVVNALLEVTIRLKVRGPNRKTQSVSVVVDTGFNGCLTLPPSIIAQLGLAWHRRGRAILADGDVTVFDIYSGVVMWDGRELAIPVDELDATPLVGTALLAEHELKAAFRPRGKATIKRLRPH